MASEEEDLGLFLGQNARDKLISNFLKRIILDKPQITTKQPPVKAGGLNLIIGKSISVFLEHLQKNLKGTSKN
jgi:hypothetical protein